MSGEYRESHSGDKRISERIGLIQEYGERNCDPTLNAITQQSQRCSGLVTRTKNVGSSWVLRAVGARIIEPKQLADHDCKRN